MNRCLAAGAALAETSANCLVIHYENVVSDPLGVANQMYRFIGVSEVEQLNLEAGQLEPPRNRESWTDWSTPGTTHGEVIKDRVRVAEKKLRRSDWDYTCARAMQHPLLTERYAIPSVRLTIAARWCVARSLALRIKEGTPELWASLRRRLAL